MDNFELFSSFKYFKDDTPRTISFDRGLDYFKLILAFVV